MLNNLSVPQHRSGHEQGVDAVQNPAMARQQSSGILHSGRSLERRFGQISRLSGHIDYDCEQQPVERRTCEAQNENVMPGKLGRQLISNPVARRLPRSEPTAPSQVLFGLSLGASLCRPNTRPTYKATMSPAHTTQRRKVTSHLPSSELRSIGSAMSVKPV